jgi:gas vesicle protein
MTQKPSSGEGETKKAWEEVGQHFSDVGKRIGEHYRGLESETQTTAETQGQTVKDAIQKVVDELDQAFTGLGNALRDPQTKDSLTKAAKSLGDALDSTFAGLGERIRQRNRKVSPGGTGQGQSGDKPMA